MKFAFRAIFRAHKILKYQYLDQGFLTGDKLTLSGINIIPVMLVKFFFVTATALQWRKTGGRSPQPPTDFYGFHIKNTHLRTLLMENGRTALAVSAVSNRQ